MMPLVSALSFLFLPNEASRPPSVIGSEPTSLTTSCGANFSFRLVSWSSAVKAGTEKEITTWAPAAFSAATCGPTLMLVGL